MRWWPWRDNKTSALQARGSWIKLGVRYFFVALFTRNTLSNLFLSFKRLNCTISNKEIKGYYPKMCSVSLRWMRRAETRCVAKHKCSTNVRKRKSLRL
ncbi:hypothetical protein TSAR_001867 [Trichomalopsis sarcophagae]|uniref:Uncharacterized protein n=1 Tax=Trichomalopsis sarcophagae TaxID=543379 RepID=A0A232EH81_9HYME|nr:hypothetical protein TSAR_001867 [Trichomalopsis sarcophagae]